MHTKITVLVLAPLAVITFLTGCGAGTGKVESAKSQSGELAGGEDSSQTEPPNTSVASSDAAKTEALTMSDKLSGATNPQDANSDSSASSDGEVAKTDDEWRKELTDEQFRVMRQCGTEPAFSGKYWNTHTPGEYLCAGCGQTLFSSDTKFESGSGWPSFYQPMDSGAVEEKSDNTYGMNRTEVKCQRCGAHLGHVFDDGPTPTGLRYCINSASLELKPNDSSKKK